MKLITLLCLLFSFSSFANTVYFKCVASSTELIGNAYENKLLSEFKICANSHTCHADSFVTDKNYYGITVQEQDENGLIAFYITGRSLSDSKYQKEQDVLYMTFDDKRGGQVMYKGLGDDLLLLDCSVLN